MRGPKQMHNKYERTKNNNNNNNNNTTTNNNNKNNKNNNNNTGQTGNTGDNAWTPPRLSASWTNYSMHTTQQNQNQRE